MIHADHLPKISIPESVLISINKQLHNAAELGRTRARLSGIPKYCGKSIVDLLISKGYTIAYREYHKSSAYIAIGVMWG